MTIHFSAATAAKSSVIASKFCASVPLLAANDNHRSIDRGSLLRAALQHFAEHGLSAAERARANAETAFFSGDRQSYDHWMAICDTLDRRMAMAVKAHHGDCESREA